MWQYLSTIWIVLRITRLVELKMSSALFVPLPFDPNMEKHVNKSNFEFWNHCENKAYSNSRNFRRISIEALIAAGKRALHAGRFPNISHFIVSGKRQYDEQRDMNPGYGDLSFSCRYVADIRKDITTVYPAYLGPLDCYEPFLDVDPGQPEASTWMLFRDHKTGVICNFIDPDICDTYAFITSHLGGSLEEEFASLCMLPKQRAVRH